MPPKVEVIELPGLREELRRSHHDLLKSFFRWLDQLSQMGLHQAQVVRHDHKLSSRFKEDRTGWWATRLNQKYRLFYTVEREAERHVIRIVRVESHNKQNY